ncbi:MAG: 2-oxo acid dehydrogenase subunit E2 [Burkholderiaceae bacterium]|nr:2-oxo acid dehydrogenase subunit E2 [Burkholderiaceae bacterium]
MLIEVKMPSLGMTMDEGTLVAWRVKGGDPVTRGQVVAEIESEKAAYELESPTDGIVESIFVAVDEVVRVGTPLVSIQAAGEAEAQIGRTEPTRDQLTALQRDAAAPTIGSGASPIRHRLSPRARQLAERLGVDPADVVGTGPDATIVEDDIRNSAAAIRQEGAEAEARAAAPFSLNPLTPRRRTIAERMTASAREAPHFYLAAEVDGTGLLRYLNKNAARLEREVGVKPTLTDLLLRLTAQALRLHPVLNSSYAPTGVRQWNDVNLGLAVAAEDGLMVPVIRAADTRPLSDLLAARADVVARARVGKLRAEDLADGTFTLSNLGAFGIDFFTSILNQGQTGILSIGVLRERPTVLDGRVVPRPSLMIGLTIDHRVTDGAAGARFLSDLKSRIEAASLDGGDFPPQGHEREPVQ